MREEYRRVLNKPTISNTFDSCNLFRWGFLMQENEKLIAKSDVK